MKYLKITTALVAMMGMSACFGSDDDDVVAAPPVEEPPVVSRDSHNDKLNTVNRLTNAMDNAAEYDDFGELPNTGSAQYTGIMELPEPSAGSWDRINGEVELVADFENIDVTGSADNFSNDMDEVWAGSLAIDGQLLGDGVDVTGTLTSEAGLETFVDGEVDDFAAYDNGEDGVHAPTYVEGHLDGYMLTGGEYRSLTSSNSDFWLEITD